MKTKQAPLALPLPSTTSPPKRAALPVQSYESKKWLSSLLYALHTLSTPQLASDNSWGVLIVSTGLSHYEATSPSLRANLILPSLPGNSFPPGFNLQGVQVPRRPLEVQTESQGRPGHWFSRIVVQRPAAGICGSSISSEYERCRARMCCLCRCQAATMTSPPTAEWEKSQSNFFGVFLHLKVRDFLGWAWYDHHFYSPPGWKTKRVVLRFSSSIIPNTRKALISPAYIKSFCNDNLDGTLPKYTYTP